MIFYARINAYNNKNKDKKMKLYTKLSDAIQAIFLKPPRQVIAIVSFNGESYFVKRSTTNTEQTIASYASLKILIGFEINKINRQATLRDETKFERLKNYLREDKKEYLESQSLHAEENVMAHFPEMIVKFTEMYPQKKIKTIDIILSHSPCSSHASGNGHSHSDAKVIANLNMPAGCYEKLNLFFKQQYKVEHGKAFVDNPKIRIRYGVLFEESSTYKANSIIKPAEEVLKNTLASVNKKLG